MEIKTNMISFGEALETIISYARTHGTEKVNLLNALRRTLAEDVFSDISMPPFNKSAMDGFACRKSDLKSPMQVVEEIPA